MGSYLRSPNFNDIDILVVVRGMCDIEGANEYIKLLKKSRFFYSSYSPLYKSDYLNSKNKLCYKKLSHQISLTEFVNLFNIERHDTCNKKADH